MAIEILHRLIQWYPQISLHDICMIYTVSIDLRFRWSHRWWPSHWSTGSMFLLYPHKWLCIMYKYVYIYILLYPMVYTYIIHTVCLYVYNYIYILSIWHHKWLFTLALISSNIPHCWLYPHVHWLVGWTYKCWMIFH